MSIEYLTSEIKEPLLMKSEDLKQHHIFKLVPSDLKRMFYYENTYRYEKKYLPQVKMSKSLQILQELGGTDEILKSLHTDPAYGIIANEIDIKRRQYFYGTNIRDSPSIISFQDQAKRVLFNSWMRILFLLATLSMIAGFFSSFSPEGMTIQNFQSMLEGASIYFNVILSTLIIASCYYIRDKHIQLSIDRLRDDFIPVIRGRQGYSATISINDLVVGDIIQLDEGMKIPADCLLIQGQNVACNEEILSNNKQLIAKREYQQNRARENPNPFLFQATYLMQGQGIAVVCAVGKNTYVGQKQEALVINDKQNQGIKKNQPMASLRLQVISQQIYQLGYYVSIIVFALLLINFVIKTFLNQDSELISIEGLQSLINIFSVTVAIVIVSTPSGLALVLSLGIAYQVDQSPTIVRDMNAPEKIGGVQEIVISKSGVLTKNSDLIVRQFYCEERIRTNCVVNQLFQEDLKVSRDIIIESILYNCSDSRIEMDYDTIYKPNGSVLETCLLHFLQENDVEIHEQVMKVKKQIVCQIPFHQHRMRNLTVIEHPTLKNLYRVYVKGAPELVLPMCRQIIDGNGRFKQLDKKEWEDLMLEVVVENISKKCFKPIAMGYRDIDTETYKKIEKGGDINDIQYLEDVFEKDLILLSVFGIEDPLNDNINESIRQCKEAGVTLRLATADNLHYSRAIALKSGLINKSMALDENVYMEGKDFEEKVGGFEKVFDREKQEYMEKIQKINHFKQCQEKLRVVGRCTFEQKAMLIQGLIETSNSLVAATGRSVSDIKAMKLADVNLALGEKIQSEATKNESDIVLIKDDFKNIVECLMWGRSLYSNARKYLQLQMTMNLVIMVTVIIGSAFQGECPLPPVQLLWLCIIMDTLGVLALASEQPQQTVLTEQRPLKRDENIISSAIVRNILLSAIYQIIILAIVQFMGESLFDIEYSSTDPFYDLDTGAPTNKCVHYTMLFQCLVLQTIFQMINARKSGDKQYNVFQNLLQNTTMMFIIVFIFVVQFFIVQGGGMFFRVTSLNLAAHTSCIFLCCTLFLAVLLIKLIPSRFFDKIHIKEEYGYNEQLEEGYIPLTEHSQDDNLDRDDLRLKMEEENQYFAKDKQIEMNKEQGRSDNQVSQQQYILNEWNPQNQKRLIISKNHNIASYYEEKKIQEINNL